MNMSNINYFIGTFIILPIIILIHEFGHAFFMNIFGGKVTNITLGCGKKICSISILDIRLFYIFPGKTFYINLKTNSKVSKLLITLGGLIFNIISMATIFILALILYSKYNISNIAALDTIFPTFLGYSFFCVLFNILPIKVFGMNTDGMQLYQLIKYGKSTFYEDKI